MNQRRGSKSRDARQVQSGSKSEEERKKLHEGSFGRSSKRSRKIELLHGNAAEGHFSGSWKKEIQTYRSMLLPTALFSTHEIYWIIKVCGGEAPSRFFKVLRSKDTAISQSNGKNSYFYFFKYIFLFILPFLFFFFFFLENSSFCKHFWLVLFHRVFYEAQGTKADTFFAVFSSWFLSLWFFRW